MSSGAVKLGPCVEPVAAEHGGVFVSPGGLFVSPGAQPGGLERLTGQC